MKHWFKLSFVFAFFLLSGGIQAQTQLFKHLGIAEGLPSLEAHCVLQDSKGYIWIATGKGLVRYDGAEIVDFKGEAEIGGREAVYLEEDGKGDVWLLTLEGVPIKYVQNNRTFQALPLKDSSIQATFFIEIFLPIPGGKDLDWHYGEWHPSFFFPRVQSQILVSITGIFRHYSSYRSGERLLAGVYQNRSVEILPYIR